MSRIATIWLSEFAKAMRENGVIECEKHTEYKNGKKETIRIVLGKKPYEPIVGEEEHNLVHLPIEPEDITTRNRKREIYYDLFGQSLSDDELNQLPDQIKQVS